MNMSEFGSALFIRPDDVRDQPRRAVIVNVTLDEKFRKPLLIFADGTQLSANKTNVTTLIKAYGPESQDWIRGEIEMYLGETRFNDEPQESVLVKPISAAHRAGDSEPPAAAVKKRRDIDDAPF